MKKLLLQVFLIAAFFALLTSKVIAQTPTSIKPNCGFANDSTSNACCADSDISGDIGSTLEDSNSGGVDGAGLANDIFQSAKGPIDPILKTLSPVCYVGSPENTSTTGGTLCKCVLANKVENVPPHMEGYCRAFFVGTKGANELDKCVRCAKDINGVWTGLGCIPADLSNFISNVLLQLGISFAGMIAFLCIIYSAFLLQTSQGNPEVIQKAREQLTSCIVGLIMVIMSVFIMRLIGVDILRIPGFS